MPNQSLIQALGIEKLAEEEQKEILEKVDRRLEDVLLRTVVENLTEDETKKFREILREGKNLDEEVALISSGVPQLAEKIERAIAEEIDRLKRVLT